MELDFDYIINETKKYQDLMKKAKTVSERAVILLAFGKVMQSANESCSTISGHLTNAAIRNIQSGQK